MAENQIVIFGGSFNPPLNSHFSIAQDLLNEYKEINKVIFVPVNSKYEKPGLINNEDRYNMLKLVCDKNKKFDVSRVEIDSQRPLYTIETLNYFDKKYPNNEILFLMGSDNLKEFPTWNSADKICEKYKSYVFKRDDDNIKNIIEKDEFLSKNKNSFVVVSNNTLNNFSSTYARKIIKEDKSIRYLAPDEVVNYIEKHKLY